MDHFRDRHFEVKTHQCQFCTKMTEISDLCYLRKPRMRFHVENNKFYVCIQYCHTVCLFAYINIALCLTFQK